MWHEEDAPKVEGRNGNVINHRPEQGNPCSQHAGQGSRHTEDHSFLHPLLGVRVLIGEAIKVPSSQP